MTSVSPLRGEAGKMVVAYLSISQGLERLISHDERDAGFGVRSAFVDFGLVLYVDCPCPLGAFLVLDLELEDRISLERETRPHT